MQSSVVAAQDTVRQSFFFPKHAVDRFGDFGKTPKADGIYRLRYSPDGKLLAMRSRENIVSIVDVEKKKILCEVEGHENNWIETIDFSPDSKFFITAAGSSEKVKIWNSQTGKLESEIESDAAAGYFSRGGDEIHLLGETHVESYSWPGVQQTGKRKWKSQNETRVAMSGDGRLVFTYRPLNRQIYQTQLVDLETKSRINLDGPTSIPKMIVVSPNRLWAAAVYHRDSKIRLWDLRDPHSKHYSLVKHKETAQSISFSSDNRFLISSGWDEKVYAWDVLTRQAIGEFAGHTDHVNATAFSPLDFKFASGASGTTDCSTIIWDLLPFIAPEIKPNAKDDLETAWKQLGLNTTGRSFEGTAAFVAAKDDGVAFMEEKLGKSLGRQSTGGVAELIDLLNSPEWEVRENATAQLMKLRGQIEDELRVAQKTCATGEVRYRLAMILKKKVQRSKASIVDLRRWHRMIFALEQIASDKSQSLLDRIAAGHPDVDIANDAKDAYRRNVRRKELSVL